MKNLKNFIILVALILTSAAHAATDHINPDGSKTTEVFIKRNEPAYRYAVLAFAPVAAPTDILVIQGSATKNLAIKRIALQGVATAAGNMPVQIIRRSVADTTTCVLTAVVAGQHNKSDPAPTAVVSTVGTANCGSLGTSAGVIGVGRVQMSAAGTGLGVQPLVWEFATRLDKSLVVIGVADFVVINLNGAAIPAGGVIDIEVEMEEISP